MSIIIVSLLGFISLLIVVIVTLLIAVLKGISRMMDQNVEIFDKHQEWMNDIYDWVYSFNQEKEKVIVGEEDNVKEIDAYEEAIQELNSKLDKSEN